MQLKSDSEEYQGQLGEEERRREDRYEEGGKVKRRAMRGSAHLPSRSEVLSRRYLMTAGTPPTL